MKPDVKAIANQSSWVIRNDQVEMAVTQFGAYLGPVNFYAGSARSVQPYYINPWHDEKLKIGEPCLIALRGDFFCMPFGGGGVHKGKKYITHGEPISKKWKLEEFARRDRLTSLSISLKMTTIPGKIIRRLHLVDGQNAIYDTTIVQGVNGRYSCGHHATLAMPDEEGSVLVSTSPTVHMHTNPTPTGNPAGGEYQSLAVDKKFSDLSRVPTVWSDLPFTDCSAFPARCGFTDILGLANKPSASPAWTTATFTRQGFMWYALKDASVLPMTLMWIENHGRHSPPWNGRNRCLGLEDICGYFANGQSASFSRNFLNDLGVPTTIGFSKAGPTAIRYIQGVVKVPAGFGKVKAARFGTGEVVFVSQNGKSATAGVNHKFLKTGLLT